MDRPRISQKSRREIAFDARNKKIAVVAREHGVSRSAVRSAVKRESENDENEPQKDLHRSGRPKALSNRDHRHIKRFLKSNRKVTPKKAVSKLQEVDINITPRTLRNSAFLTGLKRNIAPEKPYIPPATWSGRFAWALEYKGFDWRRVVYVDESKVMLNYTTREWVWVESGEKWNLGCTKTTMLGKGQGVMIWGAIWWDGRSELVRFDVSESTGKNGGVTAYIYCTQVTEGPLKEIWLSLKRRWKQWGTPYILEDGCGVHKKEARAAAQKIGFRFINHPPYSPDLNPTENCWAWLKRQYALLPRHPTSEDEAFEALQSLWKELPQEVINNCIYSMFKRRDIVEKTKGWYSKEDKSARRPDGRVI